MNRPSHLPLIGALLLLFPHPILAATLTVSNTNDTGPGSFRQATLDSNASVGVFDTIAFDIPPSDPGHLYYRNDDVAGQVTPASVAATLEADDANIDDLDPDWPHSWYSIRPQSLLPEISDPVSIDGYTQPGAVENTNPVGQGLNSVLRIEIDGSDTQDLIFHQLRFGFLRFTGGDNVVRGVVINRVDGPKIWLDGVYIPAAGSRVEGNYLGPDISGSLAHLPVDSTETNAAHAGVQINSSSSNLVGGLSPAARNLISGNNGSSASGIVVGAFRATHNSIQGNLIGPDRSGMRTLSAAQAGVYISVPDNLVGGSDPGAINVISGNASGVATTSFGDNRPGSRIEGNLIGLAVDGITPLGNTFDGIAIGNGGRVAGNTIANNRAGVVVSSGTANLITRNSIFENQDSGIELPGSFDTNDVPPESDPPDQDTGPNNLQNYPVLSSVTLSATGTAVEGLLQSAPNSNFRIEFFANVDRDPSNFGEGHTFIGELEIDTDDDGNAPFNVNLPSLPAGQSFVTATATDITIRPPATTPANDTSEFSRAEPLGGCNYTVTSTADSGLGSLRNAIICAEIAPGSQTIDFAIPPEDPGHLYYRNDGVAGQVTPASVANTTQADDSNISDIDPDWPHSWFSIRPLTDFLSIRDTVFIDGYSQPGSSSNTLPAGGGLDTVLRIEIDGTNGTGHGLDMGLLPDRLGASNHRIEGVAVNRWPGNGIVLDTFGGCTIGGCFIGTDVSGTVPLANGDNGIYLDNESGSTLGGLEPEDRNLISANLSDGIEIAVFSSGTKVHGNLIGTDQAGAPLLPNGETGVLIHASSQNRIGGIEPGAGNFIVIGNSGGVVVQSSTKRVSRALLKPKGDGMDCECDCSCELDEDKGEACDSGCKCDCDGDECDDNPCSSGCVCSSDDKGDDCGGCDCECDCVCDSEETANATGNSINQSPIAHPTPTEVVPPAPKAVPTPGIDLGQDGVTTNDGDNPGTVGIDPDSDLGPNNSQNYPVLTSASDIDQTLTVQGRLESATSTVFRIEFFTAPDCSGTGRREGNRYLGFQEVVTDASGVAAILANLNGNLPSDSFVTSTATRLDSQGGLSDTSEFSDCIPVASEPRPCPTPFPDFNNDDAADALDLIEIIESADSEDGIRDITGDGQTNGDDFLKFSLNWQATDCSK